MTITDPRHPLYGRTFPLVYITNKPYSGRCCVLWLQEGMERNVPVEATDRSIEPLTIFPLPLNLSSVGQLLTTCERIISQPMEESMEEKKNGSIQESNTPRADLESVNRNATANAVSDHSSGMSDIDEDRQSQAYDGQEEDES